MPCDNRKLFKTLWKRWHSLWGSRSVWTLTACMKTNEISMEVTTYKVFEFKLLIIDLFFNYLYCKRECYIFISNIRLYNYSSSFKKMKRFLGSYCFICFRVSYSLDAWQTRFLNEPVSFLWSFDIWNDQTAGHFVGIIYLSSCVSFGYFRFEALFIFCI